MNDITPRKIKTGGDPRTLPDYTRSDEKVEIFRRRDGDHAGDKRTCTMGLAVSSPY